MSNKIDVVDSKTLNVVTKSVIEVQIVPGEDG
jgi:hypothetical protein